MSSLHEEMTASHMLGQKTLPTPESPLVEESTASFAPVKQRRAFEDIVLQIETAILEGRLKVGDRLPPERDLAEVFGVSRASVREALRVLEAFGVVTARRGTGAQSGSIVSAHNESPLSSLLRLYASLLRLPLADLLEVRERLEELTARRAAERADADHIAELRRIVRSMQSSLEPEEFFKVDTEFHVAIARASGNAVAPLLMGALRDAISREMLSAFKVLEEAGRWELEQARLAREHAHLLKTIESRDGDATVSAFRDHVTDFYKRVTLSDEDDTGHDLGVAAVFSEVMSGRPYWD